MPKGPISEVRRLAISRGVSVAWARSDKGYALVTGHTDHHRVSFKLMHDRGNVDPDLPRTADGYRKFIEVIGPIPEGMKRPSVGRYDHSLGYAIGNFRWQECTENVLEGARIRKKSR